MAHLSIALLSEFTSYLNLYAGTIHSEIAMHSISNNTPSGSFATSTHDRAGLCEPKNSAYTAFARWKWFMSWRKTYRHYSNSHHHSTLRNGMRKRTVVFATFSSELPLASTTAFILARACFACSSISPSTTFMESGFNGTHPETKTRLPALMACEYGPTADGASSCKKRKH